MASSQVEIVASSPFGCVLRDHRNRRDHNVRAASTFEKNLKVLVRDHIKTCISISDDAHTTASNHIHSWIAGGANNLSSPQIQIQNQNPATTTATANNINNNDVASASPNKLQAHSRIIDRLAAKQARQIASAIEKQAQDAAADIILPAACSLHHNNSSSSSESSPSDNNTRASSLVQMWEARLNRMDSTVSALGQQCQPSSGSSSLDNSPTAATNTIDSMHNQEPAAASIIEDDWESQSAAAADQTNYCLSNREKERVRVVDIIKRLYNDSDNQQQDHHQSNNSTDHHSPTKSHRNRMPATAEQQQGQGGISMVLHSPKLRGRQAFQDLLVQMERDRHKELDSLLERQAVSKFPQRGRIQSVLRLRCLQRGLIITHSSGPLLNKIHTNSKSAPTSQESNITQLREKFSSSNNWIATQSDHAAASARIRRKEMANATDQHPSATTSTKHPVTPSTEQLPSRKPPVVPLPEDTTTKHPMPSSTEQVKPIEKFLSSICDQPTILPKKNAVESKKTNNENCTSSSVEQKKPHSDHDVACQTTISSESPDNKKEALVITSSTDVAAQEENQMTKEKDGLNQKLPGLESLQSSEENKIVITSSNNILPVEKNEMVEEGDRGNNQHQVPFLSSQEIVETRTFFNDWGETVEDEEEEEEDYQQYFEESNYDWFSDISRPRSYWESLRQAWYEEVLNNNNTKEDKGIRQLLERRSVSTILASDFREKMDRLVMSRVGMQEENKEDEVDEEERAQQVMSYLKKHLDETSNREDRFKEEDDEEEGGSMSSQQCQQETCGGYYSQSSPSAHMPSPLVTSWSYQDDTETSDHDSHRQRLPLYTSSPSPALPPQSYQSSSQLSSSTRPSLEMELICELRGQMEQLYREMGELRKSMDMQIKVHQHQSGGGKNEADTDSDRVHLKQTCCICYEKQVDSILYRCGHMCTCLKCAHALRWSSGKCPICRAPIVDVVQAIVGSCVVEESNQ